MTGIVEEAGVETVLTPPPGVEVTRRTNAQGSWLFLLNHGDAPQVLDVRGHDLVTDQPVTAPLALAAGAVAVVREG